ncbi:MAG: hypothetical protein A2365_00410 [Candidatus Nealsonbacteria bacterium RIFOXYB1_FULL_40_15]|uniref:Uncharacterized protein n=2 Tax=Candidatus Nealsoniibacteriota TaxID=1817911 RepID=A0A1G2ERK0_9BACT|nr:MAG: hypothetical protein A2365_00410 [Candidatus Nealsonbacteria bacterium RIFOXYB1_FULL_40_15]OGZ28425.1 MAG: hypothetical protein A2427_00755 [Candidatus Nealsonbacteria bacterium RIFOXYC1_FULL_40_7]
MRFFENPLGLPVFCALHPDRKPIVGGRDKPRNARCPGCGMKHKHGCFCFRETAKDITLLIPRTLDWL